MGMLQKGMRRGETCRISRCLVVSHQDSLVKALKALDKYSLQGHGNIFLFGMHKTRGTWGCFKKACGGGRRDGSHVTRLYHTKTRWSGP